MFGRVVNTCEQANLNLRIPRLSQKSRRPFCKSNRESSPEAQSNFIPQATTPAHLCQMTTAGIKTIVANPDPVEASFVDKHSHPATAHDAGLKYGVNVSGAPNPRIGKVTPMEDPSFVEQPTTFVELPMTPLEQSATPSEQPATPREHTATPSEEPTTPREQAAMLKEGAVANQVYADEMTSMYLQRYSTWNVMDDPHWTSYLTGIANCSTRMHDASTYPMSNTDFYDFSRALNYKPTDDVQRVSISLESSLRQSKLTDIQRVSINLESSLRELEETVESADSIRNIVHPLTAQQNSDDPGYSHSHDLEDFGGATTIMLRNIPNRYTREMLLSEFSEKDVLNVINFFYLPIDLRMERNVGYCFLNLVSCDAVKKFASVFNNAKLTQVPNSKTCRISRAKVQGKDENIKQYRNSAVMFMHEKYHPVLLKNGRRVSFPPPTKSKAELRVQPAKKVSVSNRNVSTRLSSFSHQ